MSKKILLIGGSIVLLSAATSTYGDSPSQRPYDEAEALVKGNTGFMAAKPQESEEADLSKQALFESLDHEKLPADIIVDFANFSYSLNNKAGWTNSEKEIYNKLINDGWKIEPFQGSTGGANQQVESVSGLLAFKGDQVVIATRGTEMTNWSDWITNVRFSRSPITRFFASEANKLSAITSQFFGGVGGEVANGFLQTHLSSWDHIKEAILNYAQSIGKSPKDLQYTITGHSKGAAKAQLNALNLLTDSTLGVGVDYLEESFIYADPDLGMGDSGFYGIPKKTEPRNKGNVEAVVFESPRVFSDATAKQVDEILGKGNLLRVENKGEGWLNLDDPVIHLGPAFLGLSHAGTAVEINGGGAFVTRHLMGNVGEPAIPAIEKERAKAAQQAAGEDAKGADLKAEAATPLPAQETPTSSFGQSVIDAVKDAGSAVANGVSNFTSAVASTAKKTWHYFWG